MGYKQKILLNIKRIAGISAIVLLSFITRSAHALDSNQWNSCRSDLAATGYSTQKQIEFCRKPSSAQWVCARTILRKYHSLELAQETCLAARASELNCFNQVLSRNFDPYIAKSVCKIK